MSMKIFVKHESKKHQIELRQCRAERLTLKDLADAIAATCAVPIAQQKLILKGRTLNDYNSTLEDIGIVNKSKIMLIGKRSSPEEDGFIEAIGRISKSSADLWTRYGEIEKTIDDMMKGYLDTEKTVEMYQKCLKNMKGVEEGFMKNLEALDAITIPSEYSSIRDKRKEVIRTINSFLSKTDNKIDELQHVLDAKL